MKDVCGVIFTTPTHTPDITNLFLPIDMTVFTYGISRQEDNMCHAFMKALEIEELFREHGLVMVILEKMVHIRVAGAEAIQSFLDSYMTRKNECDLSLESLANA